MVIHAEGEDLFPEVNQVELRSGRTLLERSRLFDMSTVDVLILPKYCMSTSITLCLTRLVVIVVVL